MGRKTENTDFDCINCGKFVAAIKKGTIRNHCPFCLWSIHLDIVPGDRQSDCGGRMKPVAVATHSKKGWQIVHRCVDCGHEQRNKVADDDNIDVVAEIAKNAGQLLL